jgi:hypothetical protein
LLCSQHHLGEGRNKKSKEVKRRKRKNISSVGKKKVKKVSGRKAGTG